MNLHQLASGAIGTVNPFVLVTYMRSTGYAAGAGAKRVPKYTTSRKRIQLQALSNKQLEHVDALNITGILKSVHCNGDVQAVDRNSGTGGDKFVIDGETWLVVHVLETWPDWSRVVIQKQVT